MRVFFIHGLESHPNGSKVRALRAQGFEVIAPDLQMGVLQLSRRNSALRMFLRLAEVRCVAAGLLASMASAIAVPSTCLAAISLFAFALWFFIRRQILFAAALSRSFDASVQIARSGLESAGADVLVGSSWGGAVAAELICSGAWRGPTLLLAPAIAKVRQWARRGDLDEIRNKMRGFSAAMPIVIFHDPADDTVPHGDSLALARETSIDLRSIAGGGHRLSQLLENGTVATTIKELVTGRHSWIG